MRDRTELFAALAKSNFRRRFQLSSAEQRYVAEKSLAVVLQHARDLVVRRLAPASPTRDGKQTPMRGHPVFVAQHATATCCRGCLAKWHSIAKGAPLDAAQIDYVLDVIVHWLETQCGVLPPLPDCRQQRLFE